MKEVPQKFLVFTVKRFNLKTTSVVKELKLLQTTSIFKTTAIYKTTSIFINGFKEWIRFSRVGHVPGSHILVKLLMLNFLFLFVNKKDKTECAS